MFSSTPSLIRCKENMENYDKLNVKLVIKRKLISRIASKQNINNYGKRFDYLMIAWRCRKSLVDLDLRHWKQERETKD